MPQGKIADLFGVQLQTVTRWLKRLEIPLYERADVVSYSLMRYDRHVFSNNLIEKAYLIGLRTGDLAVQKHGRGWRISITTSHPAMSDLIKESFGKYSTVRMYPKRDYKFGGHYWAHFCVLDKSFEFLKEKAEVLPKWIYDNENIFLSFLAGYFDAEGCISLRYVPKNAKGVSWIVKSCDKHLLLSIRKKLNSIGYDIHFSLSKKADGKIYSKDYWYIGTSKKFHVLKLLESLPIRHQEKLLKRDLAFNLEKTSWKNADKKINKVRNNIKNDVVRFKADATDAAM